MPPRALLRGVASAGKHTPSKHVLRPKAGPETLNPAPKTKPSTEAGSETLNPTPYTLLLPASPTRPPSCCLDNSASLPWPQPSSPICLSGCLPCCLSVSSPPHPPVPSKTPSPACLRSAFSPPFHRPLAVGNCCDTMRCGLFGFGVCGLWFWVGALGNQIPCDMA